MILEHTTTDPEQVNAVFRRLRELDEGIDRKTSKHDRVQVLIAACIKEGRQQA